MPEMNEDDELFYLLDNTCDKAIDKFGIYKQLLKMIEELNEFSAALTKTLINNEGYTAIKYGLLNDKMIDEEADLVVVMYQFDKIISRIGKNDPEFVQKHQDKLIKMLRSKLTRLQLLLNNG